MSDDWTLSETFTIPLGRMFPRRIDSFSGKYSFLSNFYPSQLVYADRTYPTAENAYQAMKSLDPAVRDRMASLVAPGQAKRYGRTIALRPDWEEIKLNVMTAIVYKKFSDHPHLRGLLLDTHDAVLVEGNTWNDTFWGVCRGQGSNHLGLILMKVRDHFTHSTPWEG